MFEVYKGPKPEGAKAVRSSYPFDQMTEVGDWFFVPEKKRSTVSSAVGVYRAKAGNETKKFSTTAGTMKDEATGSVKEGVYCERLA